MTFLFVFCGWIFSLCLHEFAHAAMAFAGGDSSVRDKGYLTFNPLRYIDPVLSLVMPMVFLLMGGLGLPGGAVYIETWRLKGRWWESAVSLAGPLANVLIAALIGLIFHLGLANASGLGPGLAFLGLLQVSAVVLNLLPIPGLDGYGIIHPHLNHRTRAAMNEARTWGIWVLFGVLSYVPAASSLFWNTVFLVVEFAGIPKEIAWIGWREFHFWW